MDGLGKQVGEEKVRVVRGAAIIISQEMFNDIIGNALGFDVDEIDVLHCTNAYHNRSFELTIKSDSELFPIVFEGCRFPSASLTVIADTDEYGTVHRKVTGVHVYD